MSHRRVQPAGPLADVALPGLEQLLEIMPDAIVGVDGTGRIVLVNSQVERVFGFEPGELIGERVERLVPEHLHSVHAAHRERYARSPYSRPMGTDLPLFGLRKDGTEFPAEISLSTLQTETGTLAITAVRDITDRLVVQSVATEEAHRRATVAAMLEVEEAERARIATALHDDTVQVMTAALFALDRALIPGRDPDELRAIVRDARETIEQAADRTRRLMFELRPAVLHERGIGAAISALVEHAARDVGAGWSVDVSPLRFPTAVEELAYRTVSEAIMNVRKHARASYVSVTVTPHDGVLRGAVTDDGCGFQVEPAQQRSDRVLHIGLEAMVERVRMAGGVVEIDSKPGAGTRIAFEIPLAPATRPSG